MMNYEMAWKMLCKMIEDADLYSSSDGDLQYVIGFIEAMNKVMGAESK